MPSLGVRGSTVYTVITGESQCFLFLSMFVCFSDMYLSVGDCQKALEIMVENGWIDRSETNSSLLYSILECYTYPFVCGVV